MPERSPCGDPADTSCTAPDTCDATGECQSNDMPLGAPCGDQRVPCLIDDVCDGQGGCVDNGAAAENVPCHDGSFCNGVEVCDGAGACRLGEDPCPTLTCEEVDRRCVGCLLDDECPPCHSCNLSSTVCEPQPAGDDIKDDCVDDPCFTGACDGDGGCAFDPSEWVCGDSGTSMCTDPDWCDGEGTCLTNHLAGGTPCGVSPATTCIPPDRCDGAGVCVDTGFAPAGTECGHHVDTECTDPDTCDGFGACLPNHAMAATRCTDTDPCTMGEVCVDGDCVGVPNDLDADHYIDAACGGDDCNDSDPDINPGVTEGPAMGHPSCTDGVDNDCDSRTDEVDRGCPENFCPITCEDESDCMWCTGNTICDPAQHCCTSCTVGPCACAVTYP